MTQALNLANLANGVNTSGVLQVSNGGTGATSISGTLTALGLNTSNDVTFNSVTDAVGNVRNLPINSKSTSS